MWKHETRQIVFCLCVDDFGLKDFNRNNAAHLLNTLGTNYKYTMDWTDYNFCGLIFGWNYKDGCMDISMPGYIKDALRRLK